MPVGRGPTLCLDHDDVPTAWVGQMTDGPAPQRRIRRALGELTPEGELIASLCHVAVEIGDHVAAWVDFLGDGSDRPILPVAGFGWDPDGLLQLNRTWSDHEPEQSPVGRALSSGTIQLVEDVRAVPGHPAWKQFSEAAGYRSMLILPLRADPAGALAVASSRHAGFDEHQIAHLRTLADAIAFGARSLQRTRRVTQSLEDTIDVLSTAVEKRDPYTAGHQRRVAELAQAIGSQIGMSPFDAYGVGMAARVHDIGKLVVPLEILTKPSRLSTNEFALIKDHARAGYEILEGVAFPWPVARMVLQHHERLDGSGYPSGLQGDEIDPGARIVAVADVVEAMAAHRPYRPSLGIDVALAEIERGRGTLFDPEVVEACLYLCRSDLLRFEPDAAKPFGLAPSPDTRWMGADPLRDIAYDSRRPHSDHALPAW